MCTININVDEDLIRQINSTLNNTKSIEQWVQQQFDNFFASLLIQEDNVMQLDNVHNYTVEEFYAAIEKDIKNIYNDVNV